MMDIFKKSISELYGPEVLEIRGLGEEPLTPEQLSGLRSVVEYRFEHLLPTITYTDKKSPELCKALEVPGHEMLALAIVCRLWEMGVCASSAPEPAAVSD